MGLYTAPYEVDGDRLTIEGDGVELYVMPGYNHEPGPTLGVVDTGMQFWPVIWRLSDEDALALAEGLGSRVNQGGEAPQTGGQP